MGEHCSSIFQKTDNKITISCILILTIILITLTGCGKNDSESNKNYSEDIQNIRNQTVGLLEGKTFGDILDVALEDAKWSEDDSYSLTSGAVIVEGKDKETGENIEIIWLKKAETASSNFEKMTKGDEEIGYSQFLSYLQDYAEQVEQ